MLVLSFVFASAAVVIVVETVAINLNVLNVECFVKDFLKGTFSCSIRGYS